MMSPSGFVRLLAGPLVLILWLAPWGSAAGADTRELPAMMQRFLERSDEKVGSYRALRRLEAKNPRYKKHGWLEAWTTLDPAGGFSFTIAGQGGSSYIRDRVLKKALEREAEAYRRGETNAAALVSANYSFALDGEPADGLTRIAITARRKDPLLLNGALFLTSDGADLVRIEGTLARSPSIWTRQVRIVRRYGRVGSVRVPLAMESIADVLIAGRSTFEMRYEYASINGRTVGQPVPTGGPSGSGPDAAGGRSPR